MPSPILHYVPCLILVRLNNKVTQWGTISFSDYSDKVDGAQSYNTQKLKDML